MIGFGIGLTDPTATSLSTPQTLVAPALGNYSQREFGLTFDGMPLSVSGTITSLSVVQTPPAVSEPTSCLLVGTGIAALAGRARCRTDKSQPAAR